MERVDHPPPKTTANAANANNARNGHSAATIPHLLPMRGNPLRPSTSDPLGEECHYHNNGANMTMKNITTGH